MRWEPPPRACDLVEARLIEAILEGNFPIDSTLPAERDLAARLGVTRPTLREALQRLARDGWIEIHQGRLTRVRDYWKEGNLGVLAAVARHSRHLPAEFIPDLLNVRLLLAPAYARAAVANRPEGVSAFLSGYPQLPEDPHVFTDADWALHSRLTIASGNPVFTLILNGFEDLYRNMAPLYFSLTEARHSSRRFYRGLQRAARAGDPEQAEAQTRRAMRASLALWQAAREAGRDS